MKASQEIVDYLVDVIANIYQKPQMYAERASELEGVLFDYHSILDFALNRYGKSISLSAKFCLIDFDHLLSGGPIGGTSGLPHQIRRIFNASSSVGEKSIRSLD